MHCLLANDDTEGFERKTGLLYFQWMLYVLKQLARNPFA